MLMVGSVLSGCTSKVAGSPQPGDPALQVPATISCTSGQGAGCSQAVPAYLHDRSVRLPHLNDGVRCPTSHGVPLVLPNAYGTGIGRQPVWVIVPQAGDLAHGVVVLASSDVAGWWGIKTHWTVSPRYQGWVLVRAERLDGPGTIAILGEAGVGPLLIPPGTGPNDAGGWREQPSGTYVKNAGCYGFQVDGANFSYDIVIQAVR
jgi:hypothetical protein